MVGERREESSVRRNESENKLITKLSNLNVVVVCVHSI